VTNHGAGERPESRLLGEVPHRRLMGELHAGTLLQGFAHMCENLWMKGPVLLTPRSLGASLGTEP
jgi:hypothetical protein